jgi:hypothetical protein
MPKNKALSTLQKTDQHFIFAILNKNLSKKYKKTPIIYNIKYFIFSSSVV